jgi:hypothetical protein
MTTTTRNKPSKRVAEISSAVPFGDLYLDLLYSTSCTRGFMPPPLAGLKELRAIITSVERDFYSYAEFKLFEQSQQKEKAGTRPALIIFDGLPSYQRGSRR